MCTWPQRYSRLQPFTGSSNQQWTFRQNTIIELANSGECFNIQGGKYVNGQDGDTVMEYLCNLDINERWSLQYVWFHTEEIKVGLFNIDTAFRTKIVENTTQFIRLQFVIVWLCT